MRKNVSREAAITALVGNPNVKEAAAICGLTERTLHRWLKEPDFKEQLVNAQRSITKSVMRSVISRAERAVDVLDSIMSNNETPPASRVSAARAIIDFSIRAIEIQEILPRLEALEQAAQGEST